MIDPTTIRERLLELCGPVCAGSGYELVDVEYARAQAGWVVRAYIDRSPDAAPGAPAVGLEDCERMSRELSAVLDVEDPVPHAYSLEVSSPGLDRPLRTAEHFQRYQGQSVKLVLAQPLEGRKNFKGTLSGVTPPGPDAETVDVEVDGVEFHLPLADISSARLVPDWDQIMKGPGAAPPRKPLRSSAPGGKR